MAENGKPVPKEEVVTVEEPTAVKPKEKQEKYPDKKVEKHGEYYEVHIVRDWYGQTDPFYLSENAELDPDYKYRFLRDDRKSGGKNISIKTSNLLFHKGGWQLAGKSFILSRVKYLGIKSEKELSPEGYLRRGDTVLAFMPKSLFEEKEAHKVKEAKERMDAIKRRVTKGDSNRDITSTHPTMKGLQTKEQLGMK